MVWTGLNGLRIEYSGGFYDSETSGLHKWRGIRRSVELMSSSQKGPSSMKLSGKFKGGISFCIETGR
jgi:hypothetical protein